MSVQAIGRLTGEGGAVELAECEGNFAAGNDDFRVILEVNGERVSLDLADVRNLKKVVADGERRLMLRHEQALARNNLTFSFDA